ncbi:Uncharacterized membrane protein YkvA, DUF1232 family [Peptostreptococcaceae bacterium pGA-8]|nr:Uncharacterized membrane protein YkvA, DUF1232 family [Peptostreptococcaceae bacterium pGA-8]
MQFISFGVIFKRIKAIGPFLRDKNVPLRKKVLVVFGIIYLFLPVDLIPPVLFPIGFIDDFILWLYILIHLRDELDSYWLGDREEDLSKNFRKDDIIDETDYDVYEEEKND